MQMIIENQLTVDELLKDLSKKLRDHMYDQRITIGMAAKNAKVSAPIISEIIKEKVINISMDKMIQVANSIGYKVAGLKLIKV